MVTRVWALTGGIWLMTLATAYAGQVLHGAFALQGGVARTAGYLDAAPGSRANTWKLDFWMTPKNGGAPIRAYDLDMTKLLHVIIVSDDFKTFIHTHPTFSSTGHFLLDQSLPRPGTYHIYSDGRPSGVGQQVFRFDLQAGEAAGTPRDLSERSVVCAQSERWKREVPSSANCRRIVVRFPAPAWPTVLPTGLGTRTKARSV
jgi:hypothetical protein